MTDKTSAENTNIATLSELLKLSGSQYRLYDVGRLITKLPKEQFEKVELNQLPYPTPTQGHACIAIVFWQKTTAQPYLWLLKLPLDERGLLNQGARNHFIAIIVEALGADLTQSTSKKQEELLSSNPYLFTPAQYKLASLNSKIKVDLKQAPGDFFTAFKQYIAHNNTESNDKNSLYERYQANWQEIGVQGITDFIARIKQDDHSVQLSNALPYLPVEVLSPVCSALENEDFPVVLIDTLVTLLKSALTETPQDTAKASLLLRALANNCQHPHVKAIVIELLAQPSVSIDILITLSSRCWSVLAEEKILISYFEHLLSNQDTTAFASIFKDLVTIPAVRPSVFQCIRSENRSTALAQAIGQLFN